MIFMKFANEQEWLDLVTEPVEVGEDTFEDQVVIPEGVTVDVVGVIYQPTGNVLETEDGEVPEYAAIPGFHVNAVGPIPESWGDYAIAAPTTPYRVFAGY